MEAFPGARAQVAYFGAGFLEVIAIVDPDKLRTTQLGRAFAEFAESREGIFGVALDITGGMAGFAAVTIADAEREYRIGFTPEAGMEIAVSGLETKR